MSASTLVKHSVRTVRKPCKYCGSTELYWGHDLEAPVSTICQEKSCTQYGVRASWFLINRDGSRHACREDNKQDIPVKGSESGSKPVSEPVPYVTSDPVQVSVKGPDSGDVATQLAALLGSLTPKVDGSEVLAQVDLRLLAALDEAREIVRDQVAALTLPTTVVVDRRDGAEPKALEGLVHEALPKVMRVLTAGRAPFLVGPAGTGKSTIGAQCAKALDVPFYCMSAHPLMTSSALFGYQDANGNYVPTSFRQAYEGGGVFMLDEIDNGNPSVLASLNMALANGHCAFPDGIVARHEDTFICAAGNTFGTGPDRMYVGRQALDFATLDRFVTRTVEIDRALERAMCDASGVGSDLVTKVLSNAWIMRENGLKARLPWTVTPRGTANTCALVAAGDDLQVAVRDCIRKGLSDQDWEKVTDGVRW